MQNDETAVTWWIEFESGGRSKVYPSEPEAWEALAELQSSQVQLNLLYSRPVWLVSSDGLRFAIPMKANG
jgi:hypothetical protein